jgi:benzoate membrane transport protein
MEAATPTRFGPSPQAWAAGAIASFVGFASSFAVVVKGLLAMGATQAQATSGLIAVGVAMGLCGILLSLARKIPVSIAWSTPGAALLASMAAPAGGYPEAVGAFIVAAMLIVLAGSVERIGRLVASIPGAIANAMLAGILLNLCFAPVRALGQMPLAAFAIIVTWAVVGRFKKLWAMPAALIVTVIVVAMTMKGAAPSAETLLPHLEFVMPQFTLSAAIGIGLPLFLVTMASQNIPGMAVLNANGFHPPMGPLLRMTGYFSFLANMFGGHAVNLAAITAALCSNSDADPDPKRRYWAAVVSGVLYVIFGLAAGAATAFIAASPPILIEAVAGLALLGALGASLMSAMQDAERREAALITFLLSASGLTFYGIGGAFWGLLGGGAMLALQKLKWAPLK